MTPRVLTPKERAAIRQAEIDGLENFLTYPKTTRRIGAGVKMVWGALVGVGTVVSFISLFPASYLFYLFGLGGGAAFLGRAAYTSYKKNSEEETVTKKFNDDIDVLFKELSKIKWDELNAIILNLQTHQDDYSAEDRKQIYAHVWELHKTIQRQLVIFEAVKQKALRAGDTNKYINYNEGIKQFTQKLQQLTEYKKQILTIQKESEPKLESAAPDFRYVFTDAYRPKQHPQAAEKPAATLWTALKKTGNRLRSFLTGAASGATIGFGALSLYCIISAVGVGVLLTGPLAPVIIGGIVAGAVVVGLISVAVDYAITRAQETKIKELTAHTAEIEQKIHAVKNTNHAIHVRYEKSGLTVSTNARLAKQFVETPAQLRANLQKAEARASVAEASLLAAEARASLAETRLRESQAVLREHKPREVETQKTEETREAKETLNDGAGGPSSR